MATRGANKLKCKNYRDRGIRAKNKLRRLKQHLKKHSTDIPALEAVKNIR